MIIKTQYTTDEPTKAVKTVNDIDVMEGQLQDRCSIIDPVIIIETENPYNVNYFTIPDFGRSYFVNGIVHISDGLWEISGHCDVLSSFWNDIKNRSAIIQRQEKKYNLYLDDASFRVQQNYDVQTKEFPSGFNGSSFVLAVAG